MARRRNSNRRRRRGSFGFLYKLLSTLAICAVVVAALTLFFRVDTIEVSGTARYSAQEIIDASGVSTGDNLFLLNKYSVDQSIKAALPYVQELRISRSLPDTLVIQVTECSTPLAVVQDGSAWLVSPAGKIVEQAEPSAAEQYAVIDGCELLAPSVGTPLALATEYASQQQSLLDLLSALEEADLLDQVDAIHLEDLAVLRMDYAGRFVVELPYGADYNYKLRFLTVSLEETSIQNNQGGTIQLTGDDGKVNFIPS
ncbi:cell division protein FtsQ/DivIB [Dysosmobacter sp.]|uniref:cell division protein FtsQ/DivIB n=1 Tax=Dysosmobacter sp. TaxID=2591382 RepID=UPI002A9D3633|nr:FtsQ-type POTRA domain-containing protein [Dysosmobacter sp.]MCI6053646.1 FtsQ-type POTRA domain-containing protein [Dysosmobacter sp.]MDY5510330.1 FtsQ-type POTRA domain-containing protein [Dysosmobacter sp.]